MAEFPKTEKTSITRLPKRGVYDKQSIHAILDEALFCTVAFIRENQPFQIPTGFCRIFTDRSEVSTCGNWRKRKAPCV